jgi:hypothetical protein
MTISKNRWRIVGQALDFYVDMPGTVRWERPENARLVEEPFGPGRLIIRALNTLPPRRAVLVFGAYGGTLQAKAQRDAERALIEQAWLKKGPFTLTTPEGESFAFIFDPEQGPLEEEWRGGHRLFTVAIREVP